MNINGRTRFGKLTEYTFTLDYDVSADPEHLLFLQYKGQFPIKFPSEFKLTMVFARANARYEVQYQAFNLPDEDVQDVQVNFLKYMQKEKQTKKHEGFPSDLVVNKTKFKLCYVSSVGV